ncbi:MAG: EVE domain-containing protein [Hyphomicrobiales bacterium]|nr:EVE domain-containing protein [Hyphomicrobiales bacterium]MDE2018352.1 EVE domain-containing protein [Hyphomicrobiales bacterium]
MARWLVKSEPSVWSFDAQVAAGAKGTAWDGVRNHSAKLNLMAMKRGEEAFFYHSNEGKEIVGIVKVVKTFYPDPGDPKGVFGMVDFAAVRRLAKPVGLALAKATPALAKMALVANSRLSVQPVTDEEWTTVLALAGEGR